MKIILASGSPRRKELLRLIYPDFSVVPSPFDEKSLDPAGLSPETLAETLARRKAEAVFRQTEGDTLVIGGDTVVVSPEGEAMGKPRDAADAARMLRALSGKRHRVASGTGIFWRKDGAEGARSFRTVTQVTFYPLDAKEIAAYIATGEPFDKAGGYGIQGYGGMLVEKIDGDYWNVVGLPAGRLKRELEALGLL